MKGRLIEPGYPSDGVLVDCRGRGVLVGFVGTGVGVARSVATFSLVGEAVEVNWLCIVGVGDLVFVAAGISVGAFVGAIVAVWVGGIAMVGVGFVKAPVVMFQVSRPIKPAVDTTLKNQGTALPDRLLGFSQLLGLNKRGAGTNCSRLAIN